ncbi:pilus assembly protein PilX [Acidovorax sp. HDW3]|uniref:pilus assembly PilX family protein n=1 Tax=Acidovorax sp. HDW3 TaxID=2714923 RepID=UPI001408EEE8|nr:PilX N-terminal domain-containing pilus assembly protein [Acidovorax sp. HDW3]QIL43375.1 pilus assembly protein PilX [Acidovorax sp. HDW3]
MPRLHPSLHTRRQNGVALFVVIVFVMLTMLLALWASRTALFSEMVVGNDADYQRSFEAAQALLQDAELDIRGETPTGKDCSGSGDICRTSTVDKIPLEAKDITTLLANLDDQTSTGKCRNGLCTKRAGRQDFWNYANGLTPNPSAKSNAGEAPLSTMAKPGVGARYGQYTGAVASNNPILNDRSKNDAGGWYWIEVLPYANQSSKNSGLLIDPSNAKKNQLPLNLDVYVVYRITALAYGRKPSTMVVLQQTYARQRRKD